MGRLTDILGKHGMLDGEPPASRPADRQSSKDLIPLPEKFTEDDLRDDVKVAFKQFSKQYFSKKKVFEQLPNLGEFYIPSFMNGRVIETADASFQIQVGEYRTIAAKAYEFDGIELRFFYYDPVDKSLQRGQFEEFPRDGYGRNMGRVGFDGDVLVWMKKLFKGV